MRRMKSVLVVFGEPHTLVTEKIEQVSIYSYSTSAVRNTKYEINGSPCNLSRILNWHKMALKDKKGNLGDPGDCFETLSK